MSEEAWKFWVDRGGTFTDLIGCDPSGRLHIRKVLSDGVGGDPAVQVIRELLAISPGEPIDHSVIHSVRLGTTVATNALLEQRAAPLVLLCRCIAVSLDRCVAVLLCRCIVVSLSR